MKHFLIKISFIYILFGQLNLIYRANFEEICSFTSSNAINIFSSDLNLKTYLESIQLIAQKLNTIPSSSFQMFKFGNGGISWKNVSSASFTEDSNLTFRFKFKTILNVCCMYLNKNITNVQEYEMRLLDSDNNYLVNNNTNEVIKFTSDSLLSINLSSYQYYSNGIEIFIKKTSSKNQGPLNVEINLYIVTNSIKKKLADSILLGPCESNEQCELLIVGDAKCIRNKCHCATGIALNEYECSTPTKTVEEYLSSSENLTNFKPGRPLNFTELNNIECRQDKDCQGTFLDLKMMCLQQKCACEVGFRLVNDSVDSKIKCIKAISSSLISLPQMCEIPFCDFQFMMYIFEPKQGERLASINLISDHYFYLHEYFEIKINEEKLRIFIDNNEEKARLVLSENFKKMYKNLSEKDGFELSQSQNNKFFKRYVINALTNEVIHLSKEHIYDMVVMYDLDEYKFLKNYINYWFYNAGNLTYYNIDFDLNFSNEIMRMLSLNKNMPIRSSCLSFNILKSNFIQTGIPNANKISLYFDNKYFINLHAILFCFNETKLELQNNSVCKNGHLIFESKQSAWINPKYYCMCVHGYIGANCDKPSPCYSQMTNSKSINIAQPLIRLAKLCENDGLCVAYKAPLSFYIRTGNRFKPNCVCRPQFYGKSCEKNLDSCSFPFFYNNQLHNKCVINSTSGLPFCARGTQNLDKYPKLIGTCSNLPCKTPFKHKANFYFEKCVFKSGFIDSKGVDKEKAFCSLSRNYDLFKSWRLCEPEDV